MITHKLKTINPYFEQMWQGVKMFDIRLNDRNFQPGDLIEFYEYNAQTDLYLNRSIITKIEKIINDPLFCKRKMVILLIKEIICFERGKKIAIHKIT